MNEEKTSSKPERWFWPPIQDKPSAVAASNLGVSGAVIVAVFTTILATYSLISGSTGGVIYAWAFVDAILFAIIAFGIRRRSRIFAIAGLCLFAIEKGFQFSEFHFSVPSLFIAGLVLVLFVNGIRGTFELHRLSKDDAQNVAKTSEE